MARIPHILRYALMFSLPVAIQAQSLHFRQRHVEIGPIDNWAKDAAVFVFENRGDRKLALLRAEAPSDVRVAFPRRFIQPGESDTLKAVYLPTQPGPFRASFQLLVSEGDKPIRLSFSGNVMNYDACPDPQVAGGIRHPERELLVTDSLSGAGVAGAKLTLVHNDRQILHLRANRNGSVRQALYPGLYSVTVAAEGYDTLRTGFYLNLRQTGLSFQLRPSDQAHPLAGDVPAEGIDVVPLPEGELPPGEEAELLIVFSDPPVILLPDFDTAGKLNPGLFSENNIVFLVDVSSSMRAHGKMDRLIAAMQRLSAYMRDIDRISLVTYSTRAEVVLQGLSGLERDSLQRVIGRLKGQGSTYGIAGLNAAYEIALQQFIPGGNNQVILATDGEFNSPGYSDRQLERLMQEKRGSGIILSVIGFGQEGAAVDRMALMAGIGGGSYLDFRPGLRVEELLLNEIKMNSRKE
ncbi:MAG TPA: VWA domain-containing protein [Bacteroidales bacterium]|nr:VWA domain-containing protein [Bacteroidales bacterium]HRZ75803.1 VWA domain-containing protein [Bacteroidales bacterium]